MGYPRRPGRAPHPGPATTTTTTTTTAKAVPLKVPVEVNWDGARRRGQTRGVSPAAAHD
jgi:hypothetical protein